MDREYYINALCMETIPEGGWCAENVLPEPVTGADGVARRPYSTIYYLLERGKRSCLHVLDADELWVYHAGSPFIVYTVEDGRLIARRLGLDIAAGERPQMLISAGTVFGAEVDGEWGLCGCVVIPGFEESGLRLVSKDEVQCIEAEEALLERLAHRG